MRIVPMTREYAQDIAAWRYQPPYDFYDSDGADPAGFLDPANGFFALVAGAELIGFRSFGPDGRVPGGEYDDSALDTGGGLRPALTGRGLGRQAITVGLAYGRAAFAPKAFRVTVAAFNERALKVVRSLSFVEQSTFVATAVPIEFRILVRPER
jgi:RimJ/RimL family protein N-acetyltransferase